MNIDFNFEKYLGTEFGLSWQMVVVTMLVSFLLCQLVAAIYIWTFRGLSYSRGFVVSVAMTGVLATMLMLAIGDNLARGLGMMGTMAIIRYRSTLRDVRDMTFIFASLAVGIAAGVQAFAIALIGCLIFCLSILHLTFSPFGLRRQFDGLLRVNTSADPKTDTRLKTILGMHASNFVLVNLRETSQGERIEQAYQIKLKEPGYREHLIASLRAEPTIHDVSLLMQDPALEV